MRLRSIFQNSIQNGGTAVDSNQVCVSATPAPDASTAKAAGDAIGLKAHVPLLGIPLVNTEISGGHHRGGAQRRDVPLSNDAKRRRVGGAAIAAAPPSFAA